MAITVADISKLRAVTGVGMMDCKKALTDTNGDFEAAVKILREKGAAVAAKRAGKETKQGMVAAAVSADAIALVEVNCETDFVARNEDFGKFVQFVAETAVASNADPAETLKEELSAKIAAVGEKLEIRRFARYVKEENSILASYIHLGGKSGVILKLSCTKAENTTKPEAAELARNLCLQVAAYSPKYILPKDVKQADIDSESEIYRKQLLEQGKPEKMIDGIIKGKLNKFFSEVCLVKQVFVKDLEGKLTIEKLLADAGKSMGDTFAVVEFTLFQLGA